MALLERMSRSPLPPYYKVAPPVARRLYREMRGPLAPKMPPGGEARLHVVSSELALRAYRPAGNKEKLPALVYFHGGGWVIGDADTHDVLCRELAVGANPRLRHVANLVHQFALRPTFVEIGDQHDDRPGRLADELRRILERPRDVRPAAELERKQHIDGLADFVGQVGDVRIEEEQARAHCG